MVKDMNAILDTLAGELIKKFPRAETMSTAELRADAEIEEWTRTRIRELLYGT